MAHIFPFRALRYDPNRVRVADVVTQPYDKITPAMQDQYYQASPYNLVRIILGKGEPGDNDRKNVYTRAADSFTAWRKEGVLTADPEPALYAYAQRFTVPSGDKTGTTCERRGFIALGKIHDYADRVVFRHEQTLSKPKADRLNLLRATRALFGQIFMLYSDPKDEVMGEIMPRCRPDIEVQDGYGVTHFVWRVTQPDWIERAQQRMADKKLIIADGHHRYETALTYRNERRTAAGGKIDENAPYERTMMTFVNTESPGLLILATHRVVLGLKSFSDAHFLAGVQPYFDVTEHAGGYESLPAEPGRIVLVAVTKDKSYVLRERAGAADSLLAGISPLRRRLDVVQLHKVLLEHVLCLSEESIRNQENIAYLRSAADAVERVKTGANVAFLMNPIPIQLMRDVSLAGEVMPQKSTDFYPKLLSGLAIYALE